MGYEVRKGVPILCEDPLIQGVETTDVMVERRHKGHKCNQAELLVFTVAAHMKSYNNNALMHLQLLLATPMANSTPGPWQLSLLTPTW